MKALLEVRKNVKKRKPKFSMQKSHYKKTIQSKYRKPRGLHSKMKARKKGHKKMPSPGWKSPKAVKGMTRQGLIPFVVSNPNQIEKLDSKFAIIIAAGVGMKKRVEIITAAAAKKLSIFNIKKPEDYIKRSQDYMKKRKEKNKKVQPVEVKKTKTKGIEEKVSTEEHKKAEKKEQDKILTKAK